MDFLSSLFGFLYQCGDAFAFLVLAASGLAVIFGMMGVINLAHGEFIMCGAYVTVVTARAGLPLALAILCGALAAGTVGLIVERLVVRQLYDRPMDTIVATWGLSLIATQGTLIVLGSSMPGVGVPFGSFTVGAYSYSIYRLVLMAAALAILIGLYLAFNKTKFGILARSTIQLPSEITNLGAKLFAFRGTIRMHSTARVVQPSETGSGGVGPFLASDLKQAYDAPSFQSLSGTGTTIGILIDGTVAQSDLQAYFSKLGVAEPEHAVQLTGVDLLVENQPDLGERETQVLQSDDPVQAGKLARFVHAVPGYRVHVHGTQQAEPVIVTKHADRHPADIGEFSDTEHVSGLSPHTVAGSRPPVGSLAEHVPFCDPGRMPLSPVRRGICGACATSRWPPLGPWSGC